MPRRAVVAALACALAACSESPSARDGSDAQTDAVAAEGMRARSIDRSSIDEAAGQGGRGVHERTLVVPAGSVGEFVLTARTARVVSVEVDAPNDMQVSAIGSDIARRALLRPTAWDPRGETELHYEIAPNDGSMREVTLRVRIQGTYPPLVEIDRSLVWTDLSLLDDPGLAGLGRLMRVVSRDDHGGRLFEQLLRRFGSTAHSERAGPVQLADEFSANHGSDASRWNLSALPFRVTAVHNRIDLARGAHCGELRVSLASTHPTYHPLHFIFLFTQPAQNGDVSRDGTTHCGETAAGWIALSSLSPDAFRVAARAWLDRTITRANFIVAETVEFTISPWEWRQWRLEPNPNPAGAALLPEIFENIPLFQTVDIDGLNPDSPRRNRFLEWVAANAADLDARRLEIPSEFRAPSARVTQGVPRVALDLRGLSSSVFATYPRLRQHIEIVGCPACHSADAPFVQTLPDRTFSPFYTTELRARARHLALLATATAGAVPFGPLQSMPVLPP